MKKSFASLYIIALMILSTTHLTGQNITLKGRIRDAKTKENLAFVSITNSTKKKTVLSDIDGRFTLSDVASEDRIKISYLGYKVREFQSNSFSTIFPTGLIELTSTEYEIAEATVTPGENPAHRIIKAAIANKKKNNWEKLDAYSYQSYNRFHATITQRDSAVFDSALILKNADSSAIESDTGQLGKFVKNQHLFITESVIQRYYKKPENVKDKLLAYKVSGMSDPMLSLLASEFNDFNIYKDFIDVSGLKYYSPIAFGATKKYFYQIEDTIYQGKDSVFIISFRPYRGTLFAGFKGFLYINTHGFAVQNVLCRPLENGNKNGLKVNIQMQFKLREDDVWFPEQINANFIFGAIGVTDSSAEVGMSIGNAVPPPQKDKKIVVGVSKSYISSINLDPDLKKVHFNTELLTVENDALKKKDSFWQNHRADSLSNKDKRTYIVIDSVGKEAHLDRKMVLFKSLATGNIPVGFVNLPFRYLVTRNITEGFRIGLGAYTNDKLAKWLTLGGYYGYGLHDNKFKYGGSLEVRPFYDKFFAVGAKASSDVYELGGTSFAFERPKNLNEFIRNYDKEVINWKDAYKVYLDFRPLNYMKMEMGYEIAKNTVDRRYVKAPQKPPLGNRFYFGDVNTYFSIRYAYKEKELKLNGITIPQPSKYPVIWLNIEYISLGDARTNPPIFPVVSMRLEKNIRIGLKGISKFQINSGLNYLNNYSNNFYKSFNGNGNLGKWPLVSENTFETMKTSDFLMDKYASIFWNHSFGNYLFKLGKAKPVLTLRTAIEYGSLTTSDADSLWMNEYKFKSLNKGYYESGFTISNLLPSKYFALGIGCFYHYGPGTNADWKNNLAIKLQLTTGSALSN